MAKTKGAVEWRPPFHGPVVENVACPVCETECVVVQENSSEDPRPAYCEACHATLELEVYETFGGVRRARSGAGRRERMAMADRDEHGRNCAYRGNADEHCTCALDERRVIHDLCQSFEDLIAVADVDVDSDGFISAYHFKTGALHRLLAKVRTIDPTTVQTVRQEGRVSE